MVLVFFYLKPNFTKTKKQNKTKQKLGASMANMQAIRATTLVIAKST